EPLDVDPKLRRELHEHAAETVAERVDRAEEARRLVRAVLQPLDMRDAAARLHGEAELPGDLGAPALEQRAVREAIKRVVDLDGRQTRRIVRQHLVGLELLWIERPLPLLEGKAARAAIKPHPHRRAAGHRWTDSPRRRRHFAGSIRSTAPSSSSVTT